MPREVRPHTKEKLRILSQYLPVYLKATTTALERIYVDGFAGPGLNKVTGTGETINGSPLIALQADASNGTRFSRLFFIERDRQVAAELREVLRAKEGHERAEVIEGDLNVELPNVVRGLHPRAPTFVFLDTDGIEPRWTTIRAIAPWRTELLINFPLGMAINRNITSRKVVEYIGTDEARAIWESGRPGWRRALLDYHKERLRSLGYMYSPLDQLIKARGGQHLYYLIHVSKKEAAKRIMEWVQRQADAERQTKLPI